MLMALLARNIVELMGIQQTLKNFGSNMWAKIHLTQTQSLGPIIQCIYVFPDNVLK